MVDISKLWAIWKCPECKSIVYWTYRDLIYRGNPVCSECDNDMEVVSDSGDVDLRKTN